jgi:PIN domain nuclease of toxin-antitoxin system
VTIDVYVLDASTLLCVLFDEPGAGAVEAVMDGASVSAVNFSEVIAKLIDRGVPPDLILADLADLDIDIVDFDREQAEIAGLLRGKTRGAGLSFGDRACLALAKHAGATAITADRAWADLDIGLTIQLVR